MRSMVWRSLLAMVVSFVLPGFAEAQNTRPADTPPIVQIDEGPDNSGLPNDGLDYCGPTSMTMNLFWLRSQGFTTLAPEFNDASAYELDRVIAGLAGTGPPIGTTGEGLANGVALYLSFKGLAGNFASAVTTAPTQADLAGNFSGYTMLSTLIGWFERNGSSYDRNGGHFVSLLDYVSATNTATINNPAPHSLFPVLNIPAEVRQTPVVATVPSNLDLNGITGDYVQYITPFFPGGSDPSQMAVIQQLVAISVTAAPGFDPVEFSFWDTLQVNTNGGSFSAEAPLTGAGGIAKSGEGTLTLTNSNGTTGGNSVSGGVLRSTLTTDGAGTETPFGEGSIALSGVSTLALAPAESSASPGSRNVQLEIASGGNESLAVDRGHALIDLDLGANDSLTVFVGGNLTGSVKNIGLSDFSTLAVRVADGLENLGQSVQLIQRGDSGNRLPIHNGIVSPAVVGVEANAGEDGIFLGYDPGTGFRQAAVTTGSSFGGADATAVFETSGAVSMGSTDATLAALIANDDITGDTGTTLSVIPQGADAAGLILNGATISGAAVNFGSLDAYIYSNKQGGAISSNVTTSGTLTVFGPGETRLSGTASSVGFGVIVNSGKLAVENGGVGGAPIEVRSGADLEITGAATVVQGSVTARAGSIVSMNHGTLSGDLDLQAGATLRGTGTIEYDQSFTISGNIGDGHSLGLLTFAGAGSGTVTLDGSTSTFVWTLNGPHDGHANLGEHWNAVAFDGLAAIGSESTPLGINIGFAEGIMPDSGDPFWDASRQWEIFILGDSSSPTPYVGVLNNLYKFTAGEFSTAFEDGSVWLTFTPVPEPSTVVLIVIGGVIFLLFRAGNRTRRFAS
jgi:autotransporter-associated beta strand protein